jgi:hypothetical protein
MTIFSKHFGQGAQIAKHLSKTTDFNLSFFEMQSDVINLIFEGIHRILPMKLPFPIAETDRIRSLTTINRGQNSPTIFQTNWGGSETPWCKLVKKAAN